MQTVPLDSAVLDLEWTPHVAVLGDLLCVATSTGSLEFYSFDTATATARLKWYSSKQISEASTLVLDLLWHPSRADVIAVTLSDGAVSLCQSRNADNEPDSRPWSPSSTIITSELATHSLEPWTLAFSPDASHIFSGGDDAVLQALRLSSSSDADANEVNGSSNDGDDDEQAPATQLWTDRKLHEAGVTSILPLANDLLVTGSYDDRIRLLSAPALGRRKVLAELDLGGGVWRLKTLRVGGGIEGERYVDFPSFCSFLGGLDTWSCFPLSSPVMFSARCSQTDKSQLRHGDSKSDSIPACCCVAVRYHLCPAARPAARARTSHTAAAAAMPACCHLHPTVHASRNPKRGPAKRKEETPNRKLDRLTVLMLNSPPTNPTQEQQPQSSYTLLASCMHTGTRIVQLSSRRSGKEESSSSSGDEWEFAVLARFEEHKSMNYGSDVQPLVASGGDVEGGKQQQQRRKRVVVSTSFYDRLMCVWRF